MARRSDQRTPEAIREIALDAAEHIIKHQGLDAFKARAIAERMGYTPAMIYVVFENLKEVKLSINARTLERLQKTLLDSVARCRSPETCIKTMAYAYCRFAVENLPFWTLLFSIHPPGTEIPDHYRQQIEVVFSLVEDQLPDTLSKLAKTLAARTLWSGVHGICMLSLSDKLAVTRSSSANQLIDYLVSNFMAGMRSKGIKV